MIDIDKKTLLSFGIRARLPFEFSTPIKVIIEYEDINNGEINELENVKYMIIEETNYFDSVYFETIDKRGLSTAIKNLKKIRIIT